MDSLHDTGKYMPMLPYWDSLDEKQKQYARENSSLMSFEEKKTVYSGQGSCIGMVYVIEGGIRVYISSEEGREITLFHVLPGDCCIFSASCVISRISFDTVISVEPGTRLLVVNTEAFDRLAASSIYVRCFMYELATRRFSQVMDVMQDMLFSGFDRRLAKFILAQCGKTGKDEIEMTQEQIASEINSAREVVARMLRRFSSSGLVDVRRGKILVRDRKGLEDLV